MGNAYTMQKIRCLFKTFFKINFYLSKNMKEKKKYQALDFTLGCHFSWKIPKTFSRPSLKLGEILSCVWGCLCCLSLKLDNSRCLFQDTPPKRSVVNVNSKRRSDKIWAFYACSYGPSPLNVLQLFLIHPNL